MAKFCVCVAFVTHYVDDGDLVAIPEGHEDFFFDTEEKANEFYAQSCKKDFCREENGGKYMRLTTKEVCYED